MMTKLISPHELIGRSIKQAEEVATMAGYRLVFHVACDEPMPCVGSWWNNANPPGPGEVSVIASGGIIHAVWICPG